MSSPNVEATRAYYDELGDAEWSRLEDSPRGRVSFEVHRRFLSRYIQTGARVLEVGAGPGRFTLELASLGATIVVTDLSSIQLELNRAHVSGTDAERAVESRQLLDVCDAGRFEDGEFDAVVAFGGPLSYAFEKAGDAFADLLRITRPSGVVVASVMSLLGSWRYFLAGVLEDTKRASEEANDQVLATGDLRHFGGPHVCRMFRSSDIASLVEAGGGRLLAMSASNWASLEDGELLAELERDEDRWRRFVEHEVAACGEPGAIDGGTHLLFAAGRPGSPRCAEHGA